GGSSCVLGCDEGRRARVVQLCCGLERNPELRDSTMRFTVSFRPCCLRFHRKTRLSRRALLRSPDLLGLNHLQRFSATSFPLASPTRTRLGIMGGTSKGSLYRAESGTSCLLRFRFT